MEKVLKLIDALYLVFPTLYVRVTASSAVVVGQSEYTQEEFLAIDWIKRVIAINTKSATWEEMIHEDRNDQDGRLDSDSHCDSMERACASAAHEMDE